MRSKAWRWFLLFMVLWQKEKSSRKRAVALISSARHNDDSAQMVVLVYDQVRQAIIVFHSHFMYVLQLDHMDPL